jgi:3-dehydroquinate dehydratase-2
MKILIIHGPNLNLLGTREPEIYGKDTLYDINEYLKRSFPDIEFKFFQSNIEGEIINEIHGARNSIDGIVINPGAYSHYSIAIRDAISGVKVPTVEIHLSNIYAREEFRAKSVIAGVCIGHISGFGKESYVLAVTALIKKLK